MTDKQFAAPREEQEKAAALVRELAAFDPYEQEGPFTQCFFCGQPKDPALHQFDCLWSLARQLALSTPSPVSPELPEKLHCVTQLGEDSWEYRRKRPHEEPNCDDAVLWDDALAMVDRVRSEHHEWDKRRVAELEALRLAALRPSAAPEREPPTFHEDPDQFVIPHLLLELKPDCLCGVCEILREAIEDGFKVAAPVSEGSR